LVANYESVENEVRGTNTTWLRLMRMGKTFTGHSSTNGFNWELVWWTTLTDLPVTNQWGLAVTAHRHTGSATATFCNVSVGGLTPLSGTWPEPGPRIDLGGEANIMEEVQRLGGFKMLIGGPVGDQFRIHASGVLTNDWASWLPLGTVTNTWGVVEFLDTRPPTSAHRFYRLHRVGP
jgi:hypothetical protein